MKKYIFISINGRKCKQSNTWKSNMPIDFNRFLDWAQNKFGSVLVRGNEILINSIFAESDTKHHLWCNPAGGKKSVASGVYHCWKTDKKGTLVGLVMQVEKCSKRQAMETLGMQFLAGRPIESVDIDVEDASSTFDDVLGVEFLKAIDLPPFCYPFDKAPQNWYQTAKTYLDSRKIDSTGLFICVGGKFAGRIIIPYYDADKRLIYFNGRTIVNDYLRYKGPDKSIGVGKEDVLYFTTHPSSHDKVYLCEGEFDAMTLKACGLNGVACGGKNLSDKQALQLSNYKVCLALDFDDAGQSAISKMQNKLNAFCSISSFKRLTVVRPPAPFKDWNEFLCKHETKIIKAYVEKTEESLESENPYGY